MLVIAVPFGSVRRGKHHAPVVSRSVACFGNFQRSIRVSCGCEVGGESSEVEVGSFAGEHGGFGREGELGVSGDSDK